MSAKCQAMDKPHFARYEVPPRVTIHQADSGLKAEEAIMADEFTGSGTPMTASGLSAGCDKLGVKAAELWSILTVETLGCGFLPDRRPQILFERHVFRKQTNGAFDTVAPDLSNPTPGGYGARGSAQYDRLARAIQLDRPAALRSTSWGIGQIMGFNAQTAGFADAETLVAAMVQTEDQQIAGMIAFLQNNKLDQFLRTHDWSSFARVYNGPNFAINQYDLRLASAFQKFSTGLLPDLTVRAAQAMLTYLGFQPGPVDGTMGRITRSALAEFQSQQGIAATGDLDDGTLQKLQSAPGKNQPALQGSAAAPGS
jgi:hypothetical protein